MLNFLIRITGEEKELVSILPLVQHLLTLEEVRVNILTDDNLDIPTSWLPAKTSLYCIPERRKKSVFGIHHFAANMHDIFNIDYYFDFVNDFYSAFIGLAFRAKKRIGLKGGPKSYLYNISLERFQGSFLDEQKLSVLKYVTELEQKKTDFIEGEIKRELQKACIDLTSIDKKEDYESKILNLADAFDEITLFGYVPSCNEEEFEHPEVAKRIELFCEHRDVLFEKLSQQFDIIITDSLFVAQKSLLLGLRALLIMDESEDIPVWAAMDSSLCVLKFSQSDLVQYGIDELKELRVIGELEDYLINFYTLRLEPS